MKKNKKMFLKTGVVSLVLTPLVASSATILIKNITKENEQKNEFKLLNHTFNNIDEETKLVYNAKEILKSNENDFSFLEVGTQTPTKFNLTVNSSELKFLNKPSSQTLSQAFIDQNLDEIKEWIISTDWVQDLPGEKLTKENINIDWSASKGKIVASFTIKEYYDENGEIKYEPDGKLMNITIVGFKKVKNYEWFIISASILGSIVFVSIIILIVIKFKIRQKEINE